MLNAKYELHTWQFTWESQIINFPAFVGCHFIVNSLALSKTTVKRKVHQFSSITAVEIPWGKNPQNGKSIQLAGLKENSEFNISSANQQHYLPSPQEIQLLAIFKLKITARHLQWTNMEQANKQNSTAV